MDEEINDEIPTGAIDRPDPRDYDAMYILGDESVVIPEKIMLDIEEGNQGGSVMCTCFSVCHVAQYANEQEHKKRLSPHFEKMWELQGEYGTRSKQGDYVQTALRNLKDNGLHCKNGDVYPAIGYAKIKPEDIDYWLARGYMITTSASVTNTNFRKARDTGIWGGIDGAITGGHAFTIAGKEPGYKIASNTYGPKWGYFGNGTFKIADKDVKSLGTLYIVYDKEDVKPIFKDVMSNGIFAEAIKWASDQGILKGYEDGRFGPNDFLTRGQFAMVLYRMKQLGFFNK